MVDQDQDRRPESRTARDRLRDQQRLESERLAGVLAAHKRLRAEQLRAAAIGRRAKEAVTVRELAVNDAILDLIDTSGLTRTAALLGRTEQAIARMARKRRRDIRAEGFQTQTGAHS